MAITLMDGEKLESVLYETSNVCLYQIPPPVIVRKDADHIQEYHDVNTWNLNKENLIFKGILRVKQLEIFGTEEDSDDDEYQIQDTQLLTPEQESLEKFKLIVEFINFDNQQVWATTEYYNLSPNITTVDNKSFHSIQPVNNSNFFSMFLQIDNDLRIGCGLKFPNRNESNNFQMVLSNHNKDFENYCKMIENNRQRNINDSNKISINLQATQLGDGFVSEREISSLEDDDDDDDDDFGDFVS